MAHTHVVRSGECLSAIAARYGFRDYRTVYHHPGNKALRKKRPNPNILHPGDEIFIPDREDAAQKCQTGRVHRFKVHLPRKILRLRVLDREGKPIANAPYDFEIGGELREGKTTDGDGCLVETVPVDATSAQVHFADRTLALSFGAINPLSDTPDKGVSGAQSRLRNLGYPVGAVDGIAGPRTRSAIGLFQLDQGLPMTCELDDATRAKLEKAHGS
jgi:N-acetylmuramoyl-L-alanine amidase